MLASGVVRGWGGRADGGTGRNGVEWGRKGAGRRPCGVAAGGGGRVVARRTSAKARTLEGWSASRCVAQKREKETEPKRVVYIVQVIYAQEGSGPGGTSYFSLSTSTRVCFHAILARTLSRTPLSLRIPVKAALVYSS